MPRAFLLLVLLAAVLAGCATLPPPQERPLVVLISIDGFRPDYLGRGVTPTLSRLAADGASGVMRPAFPTKTFPNHYTLVTGLPPDRHGIVENTMEDHDIPGVTFRMSNREAVQDGRWWDGAEPVWIAAERAGIVTAPVFWPGSEASIRGVRPRHWRPFDQSVPSNARVDHLLALLDLPRAERPGFATLYLDVVDTAGHDHGPDAAAVNPALTEADAAVGRLLAGLRARGRRANLVVVSDHGMAPVSAQRRLFIEDIAPAGSYRVLSGGAFMTLYPAPGRGAELERAVVGNRPHLECWRRSEIPARYRYGRHRRVAPIFCLPETGWTITRRDFRPAKPELGNHGFDPFSPEMAAIFIGHGPAFVPGSRAADFDNVDIYPLLVRLLRVRPQANDGDLNELRRVLTAR
jgi:predicted AlkP superfamily pyrophosphatase or phosphodiesterase